MVSSNKQPDNGIDTTFDIDKIDLQILKKLANKPTYKSDVAEHIPRSVQAVGRRIDIMEQKGILESDLSGLESGQRITYIYHLSDDGYNVLRWKMQELEDECETLQEQINSLQDRRESLASVIS